MSFKHASNVDVLLYWGAAPQAWRTKADAHIHLLILEGRRLEWDSHTTEQEKYFLYGCHRDRPEGGRDWSYALQGRKSEAWCVADFLRSITGEMFATMKVPGNNEIDVLKPLYVEMRISNPHGWKYLHRMAWDHLWDEKLETSDIRVLSTRRGED